MKTQDLNNKSCAVVLQGVATDSASVLIRRHADGSFRWSDGKGFHMYCERQRFEPECWRGVSYMQGRWRPGQWDVYEDRRDDMGRTWTCNFGPHVIDDFGTLVPVGVA
jgi:hypothetical protein